MTGPPDNEVGPRGNPEGTDTDIHHTTTSHHHEARGSSQFSNWSQQVSWWDVHEYVQPWLKQGPWPTVGTPEWQALPDDDPAKKRAVLDAARHWALRLETCQVAECEASHDVSAAPKELDSSWKAIGTSWFNHHTAAANPAHIPRVA
jgi:hypothetical protein